MNGACVGEDGLVSSTGTRTLRFSRFLSFATALERLGGAD